MTTHRPRLVLRLLGGFALDHDARPCKLAYEKGRGLLAYLAADAGRAHSRASLAVMLWPDLGHEAALANLRLVLHDLRQTLNAGNPATPPLQVDRESVRLDAASGLGIDAAAFQAPALACPTKPCQAHCEPCLAHMETLAGHYRGEFMAEFSLRDCPEFEEWIKVQRESLHLRALILLARLSDCHERGGAYDKSLPFALRFLELEPWNEEGLRRAMRLLALTGQSATALARYETCCRALKRELGILPSAETHALAERIRRGELSPVTRRRGDTAPMAALPLPVPERRQVTVLNCELAPVGVEEPDEALALLRGPQARCNEIIRGYSGYVVQVRGGSLLAYFGYPQASENAARLAVQAALALTRTAFGGIDLRVGIHTGVVIGGGDLQMPDATGATSGLAIHLRQLAAPGEITISATTQRLVTGFFECMSLGPRSLPGVGRPMEVLKVSRESRARNRLEAEARLTPLVGRANELATLLAAWKVARRGQRRIVQLTGEAGIGKSRLLLTLKGVVGERACAVRELRCLAEHSQSPFYPLAALLGLTLAFSPDDTVEARFDKLAEYVEAHFASADPDVVPLLARMLSLPLRAPYQEPTATPQQQREKTLAIMLDRLDALVAQQPVLFLVEDLQWADPSTLEFLKQFVTRENTGQIMAVFTARPGFHAPWPENPIRTLPLNALDDDETAALIAAVAPGLAAETVRRVIERADGIPLFAEELAKEVAANDQAAIPSTLQDLLAARLDGLGAAKTVAQAAATIGREFSFDLLRRISRFDDVALARLLHQLQDAGLVLRGANEDTFHFRSALIRDAAYQSQARAEREAAHLRIAAALKAGGAKARPELMAQHWAAGGDIRGAIAGWIAAGRLASQDSASMEAVMHFRSGLALIEAIAAGPERLSMELDLQIGLGAAACAAQGYASAEGAEAYARAMALCGREESGPDMFRAVWGLWASASSRVGYGCAQELAQQLLRMAGQSGDPVQDQQGRFAVANTRFWQGEFQSAREHLEHVRALYRPAHHERLVAEFGEDVGVTADAYRSWVLWFLGFPDQARKASAQAVTHARQLGHPFSLAYALTFAAILHCRLRRPEEALALAQETLSLADEHAFPLWQIGGTLARGWALAMQNHRNGVRPLQQCVEATRAAMGGVTLAVLEPLVDAHVVTGCYDEALRVNDEAFAVGTAIGDHHVEAELHRLRGESLLGLAGSHEAEAAACFHQALAHSRRQQAKSLELRAAMSLARLWQSQGRGNEASRLLDEVYHWFSEGFDTPDLQDARTLLDTLGGTGMSGQAA